MGFNQQTITLSLGFRCKIVTGVEGIEKSKKYNREIKIMALTGKVEIIK